MLEKWEFNVERCIAARDKLKSKIYGSKLTEIWKHDFSPSKKIGNCTNICRKHHPTDYKDFFEKYIAYGKENLGKMTIIDRGLSFDELIELAMKFRDLALKKGIDLPLEDYLNCAICHIIIETFDGQKAEREFRDFLEKRGYGIKLLDGVEDSTYGVDIIAVKDGKESGIQVKPISFFTKFPKEDLADDQKNLFDKFVKAKREKGLTTYFVVYKMENGVRKWMVNDKGQWASEKEYFFDEDKQIKDFYKDFKILMK